MTKIRRCGCSYPYQDAKYGQGMRVHNSTKDGWRCAACGMASKETYVPIKKGEPVAANKGRRK